MVSEMFDGPQPADAADDAAFSSLNHSSFGSASFSLSRPKHGFESRWGRFLVTPDDTTYPVSHQDRLLEFAASGESIITHRGAVAAEQIARTKSLVK